MVIAKHRHLLTRAVGTLWLELRMLKASLSYLLYQLVKRVRLGSVR